MKSLNRIFTFVMLKVVRDDDFEKVPSGKHNNINRIEFRPVVQYAYLMRFFYCAVVWVVQQVDILNHHKKQSGKHSNVSNISVSNKRRLTHDQQGAKANRYELSTENGGVFRDVEENECLVTKLKGVTIRVWQFPNPLLGYRGTYA
jgi:hypothetical protein